MAHVNNEKVKRRIKARQKAAELVESLGDLLRFELDACPEDCRDIPATAILSILQPYLPEAPELAKAIEPLSDLQAVFFEQTTKIPFGAHKDKLVKDAPLDYLIWLAEHEDDFVLVLRRYLKSPKIQREIKHSDSE